MTELTPKAEALREKLDHLTYQGCHVPIDERVGAVARTIVEKLGISEDHVDELRHAAGDSEACSRHGTAECVRDIANALSTLLELAGVNHGE
ncbi:MAG: hypothetical protein IIB38_03620 [Candidatus Hydrogenedentes bacterium]|nr:hypothetical protein [Candidatus Hydrogenedentota bacterium]